MSASGCCPTLRAWDSFLHVHYCDGYLFRKEPSHLPSTPCLLPAWGQEAGPQCPNVPLPAPEATDALPEKVSHPPCTDMFILPWHVYLYPVSLLSLLNICVFSADTGLSLKFLTLQPQQMRRMRMEISPCMSVLDLHQWVNTAFLSPHSVKVQLCPLCHCDGVMLSQWNPSTRNKDNIKA